MSCVVFDAVIGRLEEEEAASAHMSSRPHSKLQLDVLSVYRRLLRITRGRPSLFATVRHEFRRDASLSRTDFLAIEYRLRTAQKKLAMLQESGDRLTGIGPSGVKEQSGATVRR
jgi:hypothetical protein